MKQFFAMLTHPYSRYGLAVALVQDNCLPEALLQKDETYLSKILMQSLETGLNHFRMQTSHNPESSQVLEFRAIDFDILQRIAAGAEKQQGQCAVGNRHHAVACTMQDGKNNACRHTDGQKEKRSYCVGGGRDAG